MLGTPDASLKPSLSCPLHRLYARSPPCGLNRLSVVLFVSSVHGGQLDQGMRPLSHQSAGADSNLVDLGVGTYQRG